MIEVISIHIPKTGGTSFYQILQNVYGDELSISYKRSDYLDAIQGGRSLMQSLDPSLKVLHGHLYYEEVKQIHLEYKPKIICWLRDPVDRVISNYRFFQQGLVQKERNPKNFKLNRHRIGETLLTYAEMLENRNRMTNFMKGLALEDFFFIGRLAYFSEDIQKLAKLLNWPDVTIPYLNSTQEIDYTQDRVTEEQRHQIAEWNHKDVAMYKLASQQRT